jgi:GTP-binding protein Era
MKVGTVALVGRPNVGKSTLLNALLGQKVAIISDKPQTTRISILGIKTTAEGQIIFIDNPGIHKPLHTLNKRMMHFVYSAFQTSDVICLLIDATQPFGHGDEFVIETLRKVTPPLFLLINKVDIVKKEKILLIIDKYKDLLSFKEIIPISARRGTNLDVLEKELYRSLPEAEKLYADDYVSNLSLRFRLAEIIREKLLKHVAKELPFVTAVLIERMEERPREETEGEKAEEGAAAEGQETVGAGGTETEGEASETAAAPGKAASVDSRPEKAKQRRKLTYIAATIFVERDNHRKIVIGRHGQVIKEIGIEARREIEGILGSKVFLDLTVKVREKWRDSAEVLDLIEGQE